MLGVVLTAHVCSPEIPLCLLPALDTSESVCAGTCGSTAVVLCLGTFLMGLSCACVITILSRGLLLVLVRPSTSCFFFFLHYSFFFLLSFFLFLYMSLDDLYKCTLHILEFSSIVLQGICIVCRYRALSAYMWSGAGFSWLEQK